MFLNTNAALMDGVMACVEKNDYANVMLFCLGFQMSHLFNVAHTLRLMVQKERPLDILKVLLVLVKCSRMYVCMYGVNSMQFLKLQLASKCPTLSSSSLRVKSWPPCSMR